MANPSLQLEFSEIPAGWVSAHGLDSRDGCLEHIELN
jgi:uncharacterized protein YbdZ (MbtH family)